MWTFLQDKMQRIVELCLQAIKENRIEVLAREINRVLLREKYT